MYLCFEHLHWTLGVFPPSVHGNDAAVSSDVQIYSQSCFRLELSTQGVSASYGALLVTVLKNMVLPVVINSIYGLQLLQCQSSVPPCPL